MHTCRQSAASAYVCARERPYTNLAGGETQIKLYVSKPLRRGTQNNEKNKRERPYTSPVGGEMHIELYVLKPLR